MSEQVLEKNGWKIGAQFISRQGEMFTIFQHDIDCNRFSARTNDGVYLEFDYNGDSISTLNGITQNLQTRVSGIEKK